MATFDYSGDELELFAKATNWKRYWSTHIGPFLGHRVLDVGAGIGATAQALNAARFQRWVALEPDPNLCRRMEQSVQSGVLPPSLEIVNGTLNDLREGQLFDTVLYIDVLEHIDDDRKELLSARRVLEPEGRLIIVAPAHQWLYSEFDRRIGHYRRYSKRELLEVLPADFRAQKVRYLDSVGLLASLANRLFLRSGSPSSSQVRLWDNWMVRASMLIDPAIGYNLGKTIVCVAQLEH